MDVVADARCRLPDHTFVLRGLQELGHRVRFRRLDAPDGSGMAVRIGNRNAWIDTGDVATFDEVAYEWSDVFAKVNCAESDVSQRSKLCLLGPLFGIRLWDLPAGYLRIPHLVRGGRGARRALADIRFQGITRLPIERYIPGRPDADFVFHASRAWSGKHAGTNDVRQVFHAAVESAEVPHEVWFSDDRIPLREYLEKTQRSAVVFNSPAVHGCLGWKLGEYLALGKAIISTELGRALPAPLEHGVHFHLVAPEREAMVDALRAIVSDRRYRQRLEVGARSYFEQHLTPAAVAVRLLETALR